MDDSRWNKAIDISVCNLLKEYGLPLPDGSATNPAYEGMSAEEIYEALKEGEEDS